MKPKGSDARPKDDRYPRSSCCGNMLIDEPINLWTDGREQLGTVALCLGCKTAKRAPRITDKRLTLELWDTMLRVTKGSPPFDFVLAQDGTIKPEKLELI